MIDDLLMNAVIETIPQWYIADCGPYRYSISIGNKQQKFYSQVKFSPLLQKYYDYANRMLPKWKQIISGSPLPVHIDFIQGLLALKWLNLFDKDIEWRELLMFLRGSSNRSYENKPISLNLVISPGNGSVKITNSDFHKLLDPLASSPQVFIRVDKNLNFLNYEQVPWTNIKETYSYKFNPEFLQPIASILKEGEISIHLTSAGDIIFMNSSGIIASKRNLFWTLYDVVNFSESVIQIFGNPRAIILLENLLDLSYCRNGALIIYDYDRTVIKQIVNKESFLSDELGTPDLFRQMLAKSLKVNDFFHRGRQKLPRLKRLFQEVTRIDGAVICDTKMILAFGAMIKPHPDVLYHRGARSTAAESAYRWGGIAMNVSSDGDIRIYFESSDKQNKCDSLLSFM